MSVLFGRGKPRLEGLSVADTEDRQIAVLQDGARRGHAMRTKRLGKHKAAARTPVAAENDMDWALKDIPGIS
jgi:uncharacterized small protein (DUF1192 family)